MVRVRRFIHAISKYDSATYVNKPIPVKEPVEENIGLRMLKQEIEVKKRREQTRQETEKRQAEEKEKDLEKIVHGVGIIGAAIAVGFFLIVSYSNMASYPSTFSHYDDKTKQNFTYRIARKAVPIIRKIIDKKEKKAGKELTRDDQLKLYLEIDKNNDQRIEEEEAKALESKLK